MLVGEFKFEVKLGLEMGDAHCHVMTYYKKPMYRVSVVGQKTKWSYVFIFYKISEKEFYWFKLHEKKKQKYAKIIAKTMAIIPQPIFISSTI